MKKIIGVLIVIGFFGSGCVKRTPSPGITDSEIPVSYTHLTLPTKA